MEQRITRAKAASRKGGVPFETPGPAERAERLARGRGHGLSDLQRGLFGRRDDRPARASAVRGGHPPGAGCCFACSNAEPEIMGLVALMLLQHARRRARARRRRQSGPARGPGPRTVEPDMIAEGLALIDKAMRHRRPGPYQIQAAIAALHARAPTAEETDWAGSTALYGALEAHPAVAGRYAQPRRRGGQGPAARRRRWP